MSAIMNLSYVAGPVDTMIVMTAFCIAMIVSMAMEERARRTDDRVLFNYAVVTYLIAFVLMLAIILFVIFYLIGGRANQMIDDIGDHPVTAAAALAVIIVRIVFNRRKRKRKKENESDDLQGEESVIYL